MAVDLTPDDYDLSYIDPADISAGWVIPFSMPASLTAADVGKGTLIVKGVGFKNIGVFQFSFLGEDYEMPKLGLVGGTFASTGPDRNLCGSLSYLNSDLHYDAYLYSQGFGFGTPARTTTVRHESGLRTPAGASYQVYDIHAITQTTTFTLPDELESYYYSPLVVTSESSGTFTHKGAGTTNEPVSKPYGSHIKSNPVTRAFLAGVAAGWLGLSLALKKETTSHSPTPSPGLGWISPGGATLTDSTDGYHAGASVISAWTELDLSGNDTSEDESEVYQYGWPGSFNVLVPQETRKNFPVLRDTEHHLVSGGSSQWTGLAIFNEGEATISLSEEISGKKWLDDISLFDPAEEDVLDGVGWGFWLDSTDSYEPDISVQASSFQILSADGAEYLLDLTAHYQERKREAGVNNYYDREIEHNAQVVTGPASLVIPPLAAAKRSWFFQNLVFTRVQRREAGSIDPYTDITATAAVNTLGPYPGTHLIWLAKIRAGSMWGFPVLQDGDSESQRLRRFKQKSLTQQSSIAVTATGVPKSNPDEVVLIDDSSTSILPGSPLDSDASADAPVQPQDSPPLPPEPPVRPPENQVLPPDPPPRPPEPPVLPPAPPPLPAAPPVVPDAPPVIEPWKPPVFAGNPPGGPGNVPV